MRSAVRLVLRLSPTPLPSTGAGAPNGDHVARFAHRRSPARQTQSSTSLGVEDRKAARLYIFFFLRFVLRAVFFAAVLVFVFRFFAMLPS